jgi:hypothetical protein
MNLSAADARDAEREARRQRLSLAHLLRSDESKVTSPSDLMKVKRLMTAAAERSVAYDEILRELDTQRLFNAGALYFARPCQTTWSNGQSSIA